MKTIFKYPIAITDDQAVLMPVSAEILSAQFQRGTLCLWAAVNQPDISVARIIRIFGTGHTIPDPDKLQASGSYFSIRPN